MVECPLCGAGGESWEYGYGCPNDNCSAEQLQLYDRPGGITVAVDPDEWYLFKKMYDNPSDDDIVEMDTELAKVLLEAADTLVDDIASGRTWGHTKEDAEDNAAALDHAQSELRRVIEDE